MSEVKAKLSNYRQSPRKVRLVANLIRGKKIPNALNELNFVTKRASFPLIKLIKSAVSNAKNKGLSEESLKIKEIRVDEGKILYRRRPVSRGRSHPIRKRTSHISIALDVNEEINETDKQPKTNKDIIDKEEVKN